MDARPPLNADGQQQQQQQQQQQKMQEQGQGLHQQQGSQAQQGLQLPQETASRTSALASQTTGVEARCARACELLVHVCASISQAKMHSQGDVCGGLRAACVNGCRHKACL